jgi:RLL motif containing protein 1
LSTVSSNFLSEICDLPHTNPSSAYSRNALDIGNKVVMSFNKSDAMIRRWLTALGCPFALSVNSNEPIELQRAVCWLEDSIIRRLAPTDRRPLRSRAFSPALAKYLSELGAPTALLSGANLAAAVRWLTRIALQQALYDDPERLNEPVDPWAGRRVPTVPGSAADPRLAELVTEMARIVGLGDVPMPNAHDGLRAIATLVESKLAAKALSVAAAGATKNPNTSMLVEDEEFAPVISQTAMLDELPLGFATGDVTLDRVARVVRLLYAREMRLLQDRINEAISSLQQITSDPRTDSRLGVVGR